MMASLIHFSSEELEEPEAPLEEPEEELPEELEPEEEPPEELEPEEEEPLEEPELEEEAFLSVWLAEGDAFEAPDTDGVSKVGVLPVELPSASS